MLLNVIYFPPHFMPFEVDKTYAYKSTSTQYSDISILSFLSAHFWSQFQEELRYLHFYTSHLRGEGRHGVNGHLVVGDGDMARVGHVEGAGFCKETHFRATVFQHVSVPRSRKMLSLMTRSLQLLTRTLAAVCRTKVVSVTRKCFTSSALIWTVEWVQTCKRCSMMIGLESSIRFILLLAPFPTETGMLVHINIHLQVL